MQLSQIKDLLPKFYQEKVKYSSFLDNIIDTYQTCINDVVDVISTTTIQQARYTQLDLIGQILGFSRRLINPLPKEYFSWDIVSLGWGSGSWKLDETFDPLDSSYVTYTDDVYRQMLTCISLFNSWDGSYIHLEQILNYSFESIEFSVKDNQNMSATIYMKNKYTDIDFIQKIIGLNNIPLNVQGVLILWEDIYG